MKKVQKMLAGIVLLLCLTMGVSISAHAATVIPSKVRGYPKSINRISLTLEKDQYIKITSAKNLKAKVVYENWNTTTDAYNTSSNASISYYTAKTGTFKISFDIYRASTGKKLKSKTIVAYVKSDSPIKSFLVNGSTSYQSHFISGKTAKIKVTMNKGYTLKKLEVGTYKAPVAKENRKESGEPVYKTFKNGGKITLGNNCYYYSSDSTSNYNNQTSKYHYLNTDLFPETVVRVTYVDKYSKQNVSSLYYLYKIG